MTPTRKLSMPATTATRPRTSAKKTTHRYKSAVFEALHRSASALHDVGTMDTQPMRSMDMARIEPPDDWDKRKI